MLQVHCSCQKLLFASKDIFSCSSLTVCCLWRVIVFEIRWLCVKTFVNVHVFLIDLWKESPDLMRLCWFWSWLQFTTVSLCSYIEYWWSLLLQEVASSHIECTKFIIILSIGGIYAKIGRYEECTALTWCRSVTHCRLFRCVEYN